MYVSKYSIYSRKEIKQGSLNPLTCLGGKVEKQKRDMQNAHPS